jgi:hypothetical protein
LGDFNLKSDIYGVSMMSGTIIALAIRKKRDKLEEKAKDGRNCGHSSDNTIDLLITMYG